MRSSPPWFASELLAKCETVSAHAKRLLQRVRAECALRTRFILMRSRSDTPSTNSVAPSNTTPRRAGGGHELIGTHRAAGFASKLQTLWPIHELRIWISEGETLAESYSSASEFPPNELDSLKEARFWSLSVVDADWPYVGGVQTLVAQTTRVKAMPCEK